VAEATYTTTALLPVETIWEYVRDMDNWARFLRGYQSHQIESDSDSLWTLKGDVGVLSRTLQFRVHVTEWAGPERVTFELEGLNEPMRGGGSFYMERYEEEGATAPGAPEASPERKGLLLRAAEAIARFFLRLFGGGAPERAETAGAGPGAGMAKLTFALRLQPGGPMAPMVDAMMRPLLLPTAEELANKIMADLEARNAPGGGAR